MEDERGSLLGKDEKPISQLDVGSAQATTGVRAGI